ncbi:Rap/Ran GTPase-activating protein, putative [Entamoeba histolytica HM-1:IMSS-B]|uniref:Rap/Ran GTPase-activating protein, putative n=5 Tax=Entamoeba histolytica TaxID=5759 RepID=C4MAI3_ENTH1|nr:Rap/Ran GTPase-activating protein, putative [Entamoeba histolytica HM-1:IMSS]EAL43534.1 Rap/Ran GTPase-activating protein, putative [Entamoeba histolytica HM-1:IMSS]EMH78066.1 Rap/Ran GTPase-activating protein, putative [Entamoeba histolytica HM-1:IMSS-B]ENY60024.1 rap GTPase-activating protein, putative [Entamoeba histolytica HM-1:IMSS-A]GAT98819.1 rap ran GTPase-activating protein putative [Entamoeba histolytica]|eukprot:XP_648922.1 Rap/Ran GTPase-activating protein, putative [Entamoeba histolytica HM-1:IMSS]
MESAINPPDLPPPRSSTLSSRPINPAPLPPKPYHLPPKPDSPRSPRSKISSTHISQQQPVDNPRPTTAPPVPQKPKAKPPPPKTNVLSSSKSSDCSQPSSTTISSSLNVPPPPPPKPSNTNHSRSSGWSNTRPSENLSKQLFETTRTSQSKHGSHSPNIHQQNVDLSSTTTSKTKQDKNNDTTQHLDSFGSIKETTHCKDETPAKEKKKKFSIFKKKDKNKEDDFIISEPTGFNKIINVTVENQTNPLIRFDGKTEKAIIPLSPPITMLNKRDITSPEEYFKLIDEMNTMQLLFDEWSSPVVPIEKWEMKYSNGWEQQSLIFAKTIEDGYCIEIGKEACTQNTDLKEYRIVDITSDFQFFERYISGNPSAEHYILTEEPTAMSIIPGNNGGFRRAIVMSKKGNIRCLLPNELIRIKEFQPAFPDLTRGEFYKVTDKMKFENEIVRFERMSAITHYKFGVLYCKAHQTDEDEMFGNTDGCPAFYKFLDLLGTKIELQGFDKYRGGLDVKSGSTGIYSYFTQHLCYEIMFHVSTLLPEQPGDLQRVEKKRHIGNDVVVIIFKEQSNDWKDQFDPKWLTSQFNHIFIVVQPDVNTEDNNGYSITVGCKDSVNPFPPFMKTNHFLHDLSTREFILTKAVNGERTAMFSTAFKGNATKTRREHLRMLFSQLK